MDIGLFAQPKRAEREDLAIGLAEDLKAVMGQRAGHDADLDADRLVLHQRTKMLGLGAGAGAPVALDGVGKIGAAHQTVAQRSLDLGPRNQIQNSGPALPVVFLTPVQDGNQLRHLVAGATRVLDLVGDGFHQHLFEGILEPVGGQQK